MPRPDGSSPLGDRVWAELLEAHHATFRELLDGFGGREVDDAGDGFLAAFDVPSYAVAFACRFHDGVEQLGLQVRTGIHTGEVELRDGRLRGVAVHVGPRLAALARPGEVLVSATVRDVVFGGGLRFTDRGTHELRGVPGTRRLFTVRRAQELGPGSTRPRPRAAVGPSPRRNPELPVGIA